MSSIIQKKCKGNNCDRWPQLGYNGYCIKCSSPEVREAKFEKLKMQRQKSQAKQRERIRIKSLAPKQDGVAAKKQVELNAKKEKWFAARRIEMKGFCQCGCGKPSSKNDDKYFRHSVAHLFPKFKFKSISFHPLNWVERAFWLGCHSQMDDTSMDRWVNFADWEEIKEKFHVLAELLTDEERATKFYSHFEKLIYEHKN